jgi:hypothetical protein
MHPGAQDFGGAESRERVHGKAQRGLHLTCGEEKSHWRKEQT